VVPLWECVISELREHLMLMKHADRLSFSERAERTHFLSLPFSPSLFLPPSLPSPLLSLSLSLSVLWQHRTAFHFEYRKQLFVSCLRFNRRPRRALLLSAEARPNVVSSQRAYSAFYSGYLTPPTWNSISRKTSYPIVHWIHPSFPPSFSGISLQEKFSPPIANTVFYDLIRCRY